MVTPGQLNRRAAFFEQLAAMISAGVPLTKAMEMAGRNRSIGVSTKVIQQLTRHLHEGHTFTDAMQLVSGQKQSGVEVTLKPSKEYWLPDFDIALLSAGEESGRLDTTFRLLARYYASRAKIIRDTIASLIITIITLHVFLIVLPLPYFVAFFWGLINGQYAACIPYLVWIVVVFGGLYGAVWFVAFMCQGNRGEGVRGIVELIFSIVPILRAAVKYLVVARLSMALGALLNSGVSMIRAWEMAVAACGSPSLRREILRWTPELETGTTPADMVGQIAYFPEMFVQLYQSGEISGKLDESLTRLHAYFEEEGFRKLQTFCRILNMVIYFSIALMVGVFVIHFWMHYYGDMLNNI
jgi:type II secretory pathway component PulF